MSVNMSGGAHPGLDGGEGLGVEGLEEGGERSGEGHAERLLVGDRDRAVGVDAPPHPVFEGEDRGQAHRHRLPVVEPEVDDYQAPGHLAQLVRLDPLDVVLVGRHLVELEAEDFEESLGVVDELAGVRPDRGEGGRSGVEVGEGGVVALREGRHPPPEYGFDLRRPLGSARSAHSGEASWAELGGRGRRRCRRGYPKAASITPKTAVRPVMNDAATTE
jgi:hypothetical protein